MRGWPSLRRRLRSHFVFEIAGVSIAYCYIRKNACSAFKRLLLDQAGYAGEWNDALPFLTGTYAPASISQVLAARWRIFVYRDPFERTVSLFRNKMVMAKGARDFLTSYAAVTGGDPEDATFKDFVLNYLPARSLDPHASSQISALLPLPYNRVCTLESLAADMERILGDQIAQKYFAKRINHSSSALFHEGSADVPVRLLRERYQLSGELPSDDALQTEILRSRIRQLYRFDYLLAPPTEPSKRFLHRA